MTIYYEPVICFISKSDAEDALKQDTQEGTIQFTESAPQTRRIQLFKVMLFQITNTTNSVTLVKVQHSSFPS